MMTKNIKKLFELHEMLEARATALYHETINDKVAIGALDTKVDDVLLALTQNRQQMADALAQAAELLERMQALAGRVNLAADQVQQAVTKMNISTASNVPLRPDRR
jgi:hypothetical protein